MNSPCCLCIKWIQDVHLSLIRNISLPASYFHQQNVLYLIDNKNNHLKKYCYETKYDGESNENLFFFYCLYWLVSQSVIFFYIISISFTASIPALNECLDPSRENLSSVVNFLPWVFIFEVFFQITHILFDILVLLSLLSHHTLHIKTCLQTGYNSKDLEHVLKAIL